MDWEVELLGNRLLQTAYLDVMVSSVHTLHNYACTHMYVCTSNASHIKDLRLNVVSKVFNALKSVGWVKYFHPLSLPVMFSLHRQKWVSLPYKICTGS